VQREIAAFEERLGSRGRILIRASGTEPLIRVMAEAEDEALVTETVESLAATIRARIAA
jgi:phosphoglucosamine mutase